MKISVVCQGFYVGNDASACDTIDMNGKNS